MDPQKQHYTHSIPCIPKVTCHLLITFANNLQSEQATLNVPILCVWSLIWTQTIWHSDDIPEI